MSKTQGNLAIDFDLYYDTLLDEQIEKESSYNPDKYTDKFTITGDKQADLYLEKLRALDISHMKYNDSVAAKIKFLKGKEKELETQLTVDLVENENSKSFYVKLLGDYFNSLPKESKKELKSEFQYKLASGVLVEKKSTKKIKLVDRELLLGELMMSGQDEYVKVVHDVDWTTLKSHLSISEGGKIVNENTAEVYEGSSIIIETSTEKLEIKYKL